MPKEVPLPYGTQMRREPVLALGVAIVALAALVLPATSPDQAIAADADPAAEGAVGVADCGPGSRPESGVQGQVPRADRASGRSQEGSICNLEVLGTYQGAGAGVVSARYENCVYLGSFATGTLGAQPGVQVIDVSNPNDPRYVRTLVSPAMAAGTWETLKVDEARGQLAAVGVSVLIGPLLFDVYDISDDCTNPQLRNGILGTPITVPQNVVGHEGGFSPDGLTYYATSTAGWLTAIDLSDPTRPRTVFSGATGLTNHGFSLSADGRTMYGVTLAPAGLQVLDVADIQDRVATPQVRQVSALTWPDGLLSQHTIPFTQDGRQYLVAVDEGGGGSVRIIDIDDPESPSIVRRIRLEINLPENQALRQEDVGGNGLWGYEAHYCTLDRPASPTALACGFVQSGIRVFDVRDVQAPREVAYFNPPALGGGITNLLTTVPNSPHALAVAAPTLIASELPTLQNILGAVNQDMTTDWCMSPPWFVGSDQLWSTCSDTGLTTMRFTNAAFPLDEDADPDPAPTSTPDLPSNPPGGSDGSTDGASGGSSDGGSSTGGSAPLAQAADHAHEARAGSTLPSAGSGLDLSVLTGSLAALLLGVWLISARRFQRRLTS